MERCFVTAAELWDELGEFEFGDAEASRLHLMTRLCGLLGAHNAGWIGVVRTAIDREDPLGGWRIAAHSYLHDDAINDEAVREMKVRWGRREEDPLNHLVVAGAGTFRAFTLRRAMPASWFAGEYCRLFYLGRGIFDSLCVSSPVTKDAESFFIFHRGKTAGAFGDAEADLASYSLRGIKLRHRSWMLERGLLVASKPLSPTERRVLGHLLSGELEKKIAAALDLSQATAHDHVKSIYRKFGVSNRSGLMSLWLNRPAPATASHP